MRGITWYVSRIWNLIPYLVFPYPFFPIQNATFTELSFTKRGVSYKVEYYIVTFSVYWKWFWGKGGEDLTVWAKWLQKNVAITEAHFLGALNEIHASRGKLRMRSKRRRKWWIKNVRIELHPPPHSPPFAAATIFCLCSRTVGLIKLVKFHLNRFKCFGAPGSLK